MALLRTDHSAHLDTNAGITTTTPSYTFAAGTVVLVIAQAILNNVGEVPYASTFAIDDTGADLTWTPVLTSDYGDGDEFEPGMRAFWAVGNGTACTLTISKTGENVGRWYIRPFSWTGANTASPIGATAVDAPDVVSGSHSITLNAGPAATSEVISCAIGTLSGNAASAITHGADQTEIWDQQSDDYFESQGQVRTGSESTTISWADVNPNAITYYKGPVYLAIEIKAAATAASASPPRPARSATHFLF